MLDSDHHDIQLVGMPHRPWDTSVVTCNTDQGGTNFVHPIDLPRVSMCNRTTAGFCLTRADRFLKIFYCVFLTTEAVTLLMEKPAQLLQDFGMSGIAVKNSTISTFCVVILIRG